MNDLTSQGTYILLIRHGETDWNTSKIIQGCSNGPGTTLNEEGLTQASKLADHLWLSHSEITAIYSSDLERAKQTAKKTAEKFSKCIYETHQELREAYYGSAEGMERSHFYEIEQKLISTYPDWKVRFKMQPITGAESPSEVAMRVKKCLLLIAQKHEGEKIAVFTHGRVMKYLMMDLTDCESVKSFANCSTLHLICQGEEIKYIKRE